VAGATGSYADLKIYCIFDGSDDKKEDESRHFDWINKTRASATLPVSSSRYHVCAHAAGSHGRVERFLPAALSTGKSETF
jgi:hypothetical protein